MTLRIYITFLFSLFIGITLYGQKQDYAELEKRIDSLRTVWDVPGLSVAIVQDGDVVFNRGFGEREKGKGKPTNGQSLYAIASISKAFTGAALAMLVDEGKISWDDKVVTFLPWFKLYDPWVTQQMTIKDLLTHRSGLGTFSGDLLWHASTLSMEEVVRGARYLEPKFEFRDGYGYQNIMYVAAGLVLEKVSGQSWADFVRSRILEPIGMKHTLTSVTQIPASGNVAIPHSGQPGENIPIPYINWDNMAPAGALVSCTEDLCKWMTLQLNRGKWKDKTIFTEDRWREMWTNYNPQPISAFAERTYPGQSFSGYGLGWSLKTYRGEKIVSHGGGYDSMISNLTMIPGKNAGFVILSNNVTILPHVLHLTLMDFIIGTNDDETDWSAMFMNYSQNKQKQENARVQNLMDLRIDPPNHSLPLDDYAGTYGGPMYGNTKVWLENDTLRFQMVPTPLFHGWLEPMNHDTFILHWSEVHMLPIGTAQFIVDGHGKTEELRMDVPNDDFWFDELEMKRLDID